MTCYKLHYFNGRGAAENARILFKLKGVDFEDKRYAGESWQEFKESTPNGQMPVLEIDGKMFPQSNAIDWYLAEKFGFAGKTAEDRLLISILIGNRQDVAKQWPFGDVEDKEKKIAKVLDELVPQFLDKLESDLKNRNTKSGFYLDEVSLADVVVLNFYSFYTAANRRPKGVDKYPRIKAIVNKISEIPNVKAWLKARPDSEF